METEQGEMKKKPTMSIKQSVFEGVLLDFLLLAIASTIMDSGHLFSILFFLFIAHWACNGVVLSVQKYRQSRTGKDIIRFGLFPLMLIAFLLRGLLALLGIGF